MINICTEHNAARYPNNAASILAHSTMTGSKWMRSCRPGREARRLIGFSFALRNRFSRKGSQSRISAEPRERERLPLRTSNFEGLVLFFFKFTSNLHWYPTDSESVSHGEKVRVSHMHFDVACPETTVGDARYIDGSAILRPASGMHCMQCRRCSISAIVVCMVRHCAAIHGKH